MRGWLPREGRPPGSPVATLMTSLHIQAAGGGFPYRPGCLVRTRRPKLRHIKNSSVCSFPRLSQYKYRTGPIVVQVDLTVWALVSRRGAETISSRRQQSLFTAPQHPADAHLNPSVLRHQRPSHTDLGIQSWIKEPLRKLKEVMGSFQETCKYANKPIPIWLRAPRTLPPQPTLAGLQTPSEGRVVTSPWETVKNRNGATSTFLVSVSRRPSHPVAPAGLLKDPHR